MDRSHRPCPPVAVVALGDPERGDEALPVRVMGRARTLIGGMARFRARPAKLELMAEGPAGSAAVALAPPVVPGTLIEWIEGGNAGTRLEGLLDGRRRVVLIDLYRGGEKPGTVYHWHIERAQGAAVTLLEHFQKKADMGLDHLAFWLEDDLPEKGLDFIGIEPHDVAGGQGLSTPVRRRLATISSQVAAILIRVMSEEGW